MLNYNGRKLKLGKLTIPLGKLTILKEKPGVISKDYIWVGVHESWLYLSDTLIGLMWKIVTEWKNDKHLSGY